MAILWRAEPAILKFTFISDETESLLRHELE
jgi:hypothetical protein